MKLLMNQLVELCGSILWTPDTYIRDEKIRQTTGYCYLVRLFLIVSSSFISTSIIGRILLVNIFLLVSPVNNCACSIKHHIGIEDVNLFFWTGLPRDVSASAVQQFFQINHHIDIVLHCYWWYGNQKLQLSSSIYLECFQTISNVI